LQVPRDAEDAVRRPTAELALDGGVGDESRVVLRDAGAHERGDREAEELVACRDVRGAHSARCTTSPSRTVARTFVFMISSGAVSYGSWSTSIRSARLPTAIVPASFSSKVA